MQKTPMEMIRLLPDDAFKDAKKFIGLGEALGCKSQVRFATAHKTWKCVFSKKKPARVLFTLECTENWWRVKAMLSNLEQYKEALGSCSDTIIDLIKSAYDCRNCSSRCKGPKPFYLDGAVYRKCLGCSFYFAELDEGDQTSLIRLLKEEARF